MRNEERKRLSQIGKYNPQFSGIASLSKLQVTLIAHEDHASQRICLRYSLARERTNCGIKNERLSSRRASRPKNIGEQVVDRAAAAMTFPQLASDLMSPAGTFATSAV